MDEVDRLHDAYEKTDRVAAQQHAKAAALAQLQQETQLAIAEGRPTPDQLEAQRQINHAKIMAGEDPEPNRDAMINEGGPVEGPVYSSITEALAGAVGEAYNENPENDRWERGGETTIRWGITTADEGVGAQIGFSVQVDGKEPGVILLDLDEQRLKNWQRGLQNADGPRRFSYGIVQKTFEVAAMETAALLLGAIHEVQEGLHLNGPQEPAESGTEDVEHDVDEPEPLVVAPTAIPDEEVQAFLRSNAANQGGPTMDPPPDFTELSNAAKAFLEKNSGR
jgi:hypothetical protein